MNAVWTMKNTLNGYVDSTTEVDTMLHRDWLAADANPSDLLVCLISVKFTVHIAPTALAHTRLSILPAFLCI